MTETTNQELVDDIVRFIEAGQFLCPRCPISDERFIIISDFAEAQEYAYRRCITDADDAPNWTDLRENVAGQIRGITYENPSLAAARQASDELFARTASYFSRVSEKHAAVADDVIADLCNCAFSRAVLGAGTGLFDLMWDAYRQGGWPCGWVGDFPEGKLVVFQPTN